MLPGNSHQFTRSIYVKLERTRNETPKVCLQIFWIICKNVLLKVIIERTAFVLAESDEKNATTLC